MPDQKDTYSDGSPSVIVTVECDDPEIADRLGRIFASQAAGLLSTGNVRFTNTSDETDTMPGIGRLIDVYSRNPSDRYDEQYLENGEDV